MEITTRKLNREELFLVRQVADIVWPITFRPILSDEQIAYMMEMMYAPEVMAKEFDEGIQFNGVFDGDRAVGYYIWGCCDSGPETAKLHKCYLLPEYQGKGIGSQMLREAKEQAAQAGFARIRLNVNRHNEKAMRSYFRNGFKCIEMVDKPIGNGFFMNDFIMEAELRNFGEEGESVGGASEDGAPEAISAMPDLSKQAAVIASLADDFDYVCHIDYDSGRFYRFRTSEQIVDSVVGIDQTLPFLTRLELVFRKMVYPEDLPQFLERFSKDRVLKELADKPVYKFETRLNHDGVPEFYRIKFARDQKNRHAVILGLLNIDKQVRAEILQGEQEAKTESLRQMAELNRELAAANAFSDLFIGTYISAFYVNLADNKMTVYHRIGSQEEKYDETENYQDFMNEYISSDVHPNDRPNMLEMIKPDVIRRRLRTENEFSVILRDISGGMERFVRFQVVKGHDDDHVAFGFTDIDREFRDEQEKKRIVEQNLELISGLASEFYSVYYVDLKTYNVTPYARTSDERTRIEKAYGRTIYHPNAYQSYVKTHVDACDQEMMLEAGSISHIKEVLSKQSTYSVTYRSGNRFWEVKFIRVNGLDDEPAAVIVAYSDKDAEVISHFIHEKLMDDYVSIYLVDVEHDVFRRCKVSGTFAETIDTAKGWSSAVRRYAERCTEDTKDILMMATSERIREQMATQDRQEFLYRFADEENEWRHGTIQVIQRRDEVPVTVIMAISIADSFTVEKEELNLRIAEQNRQMEQNLEIIGGLASEYTALYHLNLDTKMFKVYSISDRLADTQKLIKTKGGFFDLYRMFVNSVVHPDDRKMMLELASVEKIREVLKDRKAYSTLFRRNYDGQYLWTEQIFVKFADKDKEASSIAIGYIEKDKEIRERDVQQKQLEEALKMAQSANRAKTAFLNNMSHDIRTPMNAIIGFSGLAASHIDNKEQVLDYLRKIGQSSDHLLSLINEVLDMSRIESGKMMLNEKEENLSEILHALRDIIHADINAKQLELFIDTVDVTHEMVVCDKLRVNQVLLNITSNAIKYTRPGGTITIRIIQKAVTQTGYGSYEFHIKDTGIGMSEDYVKTIFEPFTRESTSTVSGIQGTGLGMAITKNIVDMMGGKINVFTKKGEGTEFVLTLDFKLAGKQEAESFQIEKLHGLRGLVVDDDSNTCLSISRMLRETGMRSEWCVSGKEAVLRTTEAMQIGDLYKVYIIDWMMPDMNGVETTRRIRKVVGDNVPIIILTAYDWSDIEDEAREAGVSGFVSKPLFPSDLHNALMKFCGDGEPKVVEKETVSQEFIGKRILLVDDNELNCEIAQELLKENGFVVETASDGTVAVEKMKQAAAGAYDVVLMDIQMPVMDGYEAAKAIRAIGNDYCRSVPIIAMTANAFAEDRQAALDAGMNDHVPKPIKVNVLMETLKKYL